MHDKETLIRVGSGVAARYEDVEAAYICGSLVEGFGNSRSDLDVFVLSNGAARLKPDAGDPTRLSLDEFQVDLDYADDLAVDTECWEINLVRDILVRLNTCPVEDYTAAATLEQSYFQLAHGIRIGSPVARADCFQALRDSVDWAHVCQVLHCRYSLSYNGAADDAAGAIYAKDAGTALLTSRMALGDAADALLAALGSTNIKPKWRFAKMRALGLAELAERYLAIELIECEQPGGIPDDAALLEAAKERLRFAGDLTVRAAAAVGRLHHAAEAT